MKFFLKLKLAAQEVILSINAIHCLLIQMLDVSAEYKKVVKVVLTKLRTA